MKDLRKWLMRQFKNSVSLRYLTIVSSFVLVVQLIFSLLQIQRNQARQMAILHEQVQSNTNFIRDIAPEAIFNLDFLYLETLMQQTAEETDVVYSVIINQNGKALTRYLNHEHPLIKSVIENIETPQDDILTVLAEVDRLPLVHKKQVSIESYGQPLGEVHIGFSMQRMRSESFRAAVNSIITALSVSLLLAILTIVLFNRQVHGPLKSLRKFAYGFEEGNLSQRIQIQNPDEIGQVGRALNRMADQLQENLVGLAKARDQAIAANKAKSDFLANMSHELRTPLNAILGFSELMTHESDTTPTQKRNLEIINNSGEHLLSLINDILEMAKIESGQTSIEPIAFDLHHFLKTLYQMLNVRVQAQNLHFAFDYPSDLPQYIQADENKLRQVLLNLLSNAVKFTKKGSVVMQTKAYLARSESQEDYRISFAVEDTGPGISNDNLAVIFDPFEQTEVGRNSQQGTGLGLAISRRYVRLMGGDLTVSSQVGKGSVFQFSVPIQLADAASVQTNIREPYRIIGLAPDQPPYRILIVEDVQENRHLLTRVLELAGFEVQTAINGIEGLNQWKSWQPHLILMDLRMPVMDGFEATRCIRDLESNSRSNGHQTTIIVALTAFAFEDHRQMALDAGCDGYIRKPFREQALFEEIAQYLGVRYQYEGDDPTAISENSITPLKAFSVEDIRAQIAAMPQDWLTQIHEAAVQLDHEKTSNLIQQIMDSHHELAMQLHTWVTNFRFDKITHYTTDILELT